MNNKLMIEMLRRGKTGNEIMCILDAISGDALTPQAREVVLQSQNYQEINPEDF
jgi:hypothetical protein